MIWRVAGRAVNGAGTAPVRSAIHERTWGRQAAPWQVPRQAWLDALEELELLEAAVPGRLQVVDGHAHAAAHDPWRGRRRERRPHVAAPDHADRDLAGHPRQDVARRQPEAEDQRAAWRGRLGADPVVGRDDGADPTPIVALDADQAPGDGRARDARGRRADGHGVGERDAGRVQSLGGARGQEAVEVVARHRRLDLGGARSRRRLVGADVEHERGRPHDERRARVDADDLVAELGVEDEHPATGRLRGACGLAAAGPTTDDRDVDLGTAARHGPARSPLITGSAGSPSRG